MRTPVLEFLWTLLMINGDWKQSQSLQAIWIELPSTQLIN